MSDTAGSSAPQVKGGGKKKLILILAAVLLLGGGAGAGYYFMVKKPSDEKAALEAKKKAGSDHAESGDEHKDVAQEDGSEADDNGHAAVPPDTLVLDIFTANIHPIEAEKYLQVGLVLKIKGGEAGGHGAGGADAFKPYIPDIRNAVIAKMAELKSEDVTGSEKREALREDFKKAIKAVLPGPMRKQLQDVLYTQFVMQ